jgi:hypothetical protein
VKLVRAGATDAEQRAQAMKDLVEQETYLQRLIAFSRFEAKSPTPVKSSAR